MENQKKLLHEKQIREIQLREVNDIKKAERKAKKEYEQGLVNNLK